MTETTTISSADGLTLRAAIDAPAQPWAALVLCHPHPRMGGTMNAPLLVALTDRLVEAGLSVARFNFRGLEGSEGTSSDGIAEVADALGAVAAARERWPGLPLGIAGWSFGAGVALRTIAEEQIDACAVIAPPIEAKPDITAGAPDPATVGGRSRLLVVCGANDEVVSPEACRRWAETAGARYLEMRGANHFFWAKYDDLADALIDFLEEAMG